MVYGTEANCMRHNYMGQNYPGTCTRKKLSICACISHASAVLSGCTFLGSDFEAAPRVWMHGMDAWYGYGVMHGVDA